MKKQIIAIVLLISTVSYAKDKQVDNQIVEVAVTENGFEPSQIAVKPNVPVTLKVTRKTDNTCATEVVIKEKNVKKELPLNQAVIIDLGSFKKGEHKFSCGMNMLSGQIISK